MLREILETLLQGQFICSISHNELYQELQNVDIKLKVDEVLKSLGKELRQTEGNTAYYCAYDDLSNPKDTRQVKYQFEQLRNQIAPVIHFLMLIMKTEDRNSILIPEDTLRFHELLSRIEAEPAYITDLKQMGRYTLFKTLSNKKNNQDRLKTILEIMSKEGYIKLANKESIIYQVTGKIEYFYSCLEFIRDYEKIPLQDETNNQKDLNFDR